MNPLTHQKVLGATFVNNLTRRPVFSIGTQHFSRHQAVTDLQCGNFKALKLLEHALTTIGVKRPDDLLQLDNPLEVLASIKGIGETTLYALICYVESQLEINTKHWYEPADGPKALVTFASLKHRAHAAAAREKKSTRRTGPRRARRLQMVS